MGHRSLASLWLFPEGISLTGETNLNRLVGEDEEEFLQTVGHALLIRSFVMMVKRAVLWHDGHGPSEFM